MTSSIAYLYECISPVRAARVFNPISPEYYLADQVKAVERTRPQTDAAVKVTISAEAQSTLTR